MHLVAFLDLRLKTMRVLSELPSKKMMSNVWLITII
jgi:hypothetical protein